MITPSAVQYLRSIEFASNRVKNLDAYIENLYVRAQREEISLQRFNEIEHSAWGMYTWWSNHLKKLLNEKERALDTP